MTIVQMFIFIEKRNKFLKLTFLRNVSQKYWGDLMCETLINEGMGAQMTPKRPAGKDTGLNPSNAAQATFI